MINYLKKEKFKNIIIFYNNKNYYIFVLKYYKIEIQSQQAKSS